jgi:hypothetical protein
MNLIESKTHVYIQQTDESKEMFYGNFGKTTSQGSVAKNLAVLQNQ